jgi:hypothetical protein
LLQCVSPELAHPVNSPQCIGRFRGEADIDEAPFGTNATSEDVFPPAGEEDEADVSQRLPL